MNIKYDEFLKLMAHKILNMIRDNRSRVAQALTYAIVPFWAKPCGRQGAWVQSPRALTPKGTFGWPGTFFNSQSRLCPKGRRVLLLELGPSTNSILELLDELGPEHPE